MKSVADSWIFRRRDWLGAICLVPLAGAALLSRPWSAPGSWLHLATDSLGWLCLAGYLTLRLWATLFAGGRKDRILQTQGPYSITRNPLYLGSFLLALACCAFLQSLTLLLGLGLLSFCYARGVVAAEERMLLQLFPLEYAEYLRRTPRFFPSFAGYAAPAKLEINLAALKRESRRLAGAALIPLFMETAAHLRSASWWPHYF